MKYRGIFTAIFLLVLSSCSSDLDLIDPADPIPVVFFQMNPEDRFLYLTLTKSFAGDSSAYDMARNPQSVYYDSANIYLEGWIDQYKVWETHFEPSSRIKAPGIFAEVPGYCYKAYNIEPFGQLFTHYRLMVTIPGISSPVFSKIGNVGPPIVKSRFDHQISLYPKNYEIGISPGPGSAYCDLICVFRYQQLEGMWVNHSDTFLLRRDINFEAGRTDYLYAELFFNQIAVNIKPINDTIVRKFTSLDLILYAGDQYFRDYIDTYGNAADLDLPPKGNITNGLGLFTMLRTAIKDNMTLDRVTHDSLCLGQFTKKLGFVRW
ncbi:MAG: hypothetical protein D4R64_15385 [Porphyromonadaceae bacterium]|nr:MAG: hypothetical protein D4R64_15385 [Porphyromonadaceae bacterium]